MTIYYVATNGVNGAAGTIGAPWKTVNYGMNQLHAGDTLRIGPGTYHEAVNVVLNGAPTSRITVEATDPGNKPIITGKAPIDRADASQNGVGYNSGLPNGADYKFNKNSWSKTYQFTAINPALVNFGTGSRHFTIKNIRILQSRGRSVYLGGQKPNYVNGSIENTPATNFASRDIEFNGVEFNWARLQIVAFTNVADLRFKNCIFAHGASFFQAPERCHCYQCHASPCTDQYPLQSHNAGVSFGGCKDVLLEDCELFEVWGEGIIFSANDTQTDAVTIRRLVAYDVVKTPLYVHATSNCLIEQSLVYRSDENLVYPSISVQWNGKDNPALKTPAINVQSSEGNKNWNINTHHITVQNSIFVNTYVGLNMQGSVNTPQIHHISFLGNTVINPIGYCLRLLGNIPRYIDIRNNIFFKNNSGDISFITSGVYDGTSTFDYNGWSSAPVAYLQGAHDVVGDLGIVNPAAHISAGDSNVDNFKLKSTSPCKTAGVSISGFTDDYNGDTRNSPPSIGALEYGGGGGSSSVTAVIDAIDDTGNIPFNPVFDASNSTATNTSIVKYEWDFGDGTTGTGVTPNKTYNQIGIYFVLLKVYGASGVTDTAILVVTVTSGDGGGDPPSDADAHSGVILSSATVQQTTEPHGLSVRPSLVLFFTGDVGQSPIIYDDYTLGVGAAAQNGVVAIANRSLDDTSKSRSSVVIRDDAAILITDIAGTTKISANVSMDDTNLTIDWTKVDTEYTRQIGYLAIGGSASVGSVHIAQPGEVVDLGYNADVLIMLGGRTGVNGAQGTIRQMLGFTDENDMVNVSNFEKTTQDFSTVFGYASEQHSGSYRGGYSHVNLNKNGRYVTVETVGEPWDGVIVFAAIKFGGNAWSISLEQTPPDSNPYEYDLGETLGFAIGFVSNLSEKETQVTEGDLGSLTAFCFDGSSIYTLNSWGRANRDLGVTLANEKTNDHLNNLVCYEDTESNPGDARFLWSDVLTNTTKLRLEQFEAPVGNRRYMALLMVAAPKDAVEIPEPVVEYTPQNPTIDDTVTFQVLNGPSFDFVLDPGDGSPYYDTGARSYDHQYTVPGTYTVNAQLQDNGAPPSVNFTTFQIVVTDSGLLPVINASIYGGTAPLTVTFDGGDSDGGLSTLRYDWRIIEDSYLDSGDTEILDDMPYIGYTGEQVTHVFSRGGWAVQLIITDVNDATRSAFLLEKSLIVVTGNSPRPNFEIDNQTGPAPLRVVLTKDNETYNEDIIEESWTVNGLTYPGYQNEYVFSEPGNHDITYFVRTETGSATITKYVTVTQSVIYPIGYSVPETISKATQNAVFPADGESYHVHTHEVDGTETGEPSRIVFTNYTGGTQLRSLGVNAPDPGYLHFIQNEPDKRVSFDVTDWITTNRGIGTRRITQDLGLFAHASIITEPNSGSIIPNKPHTQSLGSPSYPYSTMYIDEIIANILVARKILSTIGGNIIVAPTAKLMEEVTSTDFIDQGSGPKHVFRIEATFFPEEGDYLLLLGNSSIGTQQVEVLEIIDVLTPTHDNELLLNCWRGVDGTPLNTWPEKSAVINTKEPGKEFGVIDLYSQEAYFDSGKGPAIAIRSRDENYPVSSQPWYDLTIQAVFGNLEGRYGFNSSKYGIAIGQDRPDAAYMLAISNAIGFYGQNRELLVEMTASGGLQMYTSTISSWKRDLNFVRKVGSTVQNLVRYGGFYDSPTGSVYGTVSANGTESTSNAVMNVSANVPTSNNKTATLNLYATGDNNSPVLKAIAGPSYGWLLATNLPAGTGTGSENAPTGAPSGTLYRNSSYQVKVVP